MKINILINQISSRLDWSQEQTRFAIEELGEYRTVLDYMEFLMVCSEASNPDDRFVQVSNFIKSSTENNEIETLTEFLDRDACFYCLGLFNYIDINNNYYNKLNKAIYFDRDLYESDELDNHKSFIHWELPGKYSRLIKKKSMEGEIFVTRDRLSKHNENLWKDINYETKLGLYIKNNVFYDNLTYRIFDKYVDHILNNYKIELSELFAQVFKRKKLLVFNIEVFRKYALNTHLMNKEDQKNFINLFKNHLFKSNELTQKRYYKYYCLVEILKKRGYEVFESIKMVANEEKAGYSSIKTRYYEKSAESKKNNTSLSDLIQKYGFQNTLEELADRIESKKNSMNK